MNNGDYLERILDLKVKYQVEVKELKESLGEDMPLIESQKLTKIAYFESFIEELDNALNFVKYGLTDNDSAEGVRSGGFGSTGMTIGEAYEKMEERMKKSLQDKGNGFQD